MAVKSRQIGWDDEQILDYYVQKQLSRLARIRCCTTSPTTTAAPEGEGLLLENGFNILLEDGNNIALE